jgi:hypothetical protein
MLPSRDMNGNALVRLLYSIPVCLSENAFKQKIFVSDDMLSYSIVFSLDV